MSQIKNLAMLLPPLMSLWNKSLEKLLSYPNSAIETVPLREVTIVTQEAMELEALKVIEADDTTVKPVGTIEEVAKKETALQGILLQKKWKNALYRQGRSPNLVRSNLSGSKGEKLCFECRDSKHLERECPNPFCYRCGAKGHRSYNCTKVN